MEEEGKEWRHEGGDEWRGNKRKINQGVKKRMDTFFFNNSKREMKR